MGTKRASGIKVRMKSSGTKVSLQGFSLELNDGRGKITVVAGRAEGPAAVALLRGAGELIQASLGSGAGTCRVCGCTDLDACPGGCAWVDQTQTLCSACAR